jgi:imidazole glycerol-phosphate synthase subunit HisF
MLLKRIIPALLYSSNGLYKTVRFKNKKYVGDAINSVRLFNDLGADELILLDIDASKNNQGPNFSLIKDLAPECFMPLTYGGGIRSAADAEALLRLGVEKICLNNSVLEQPQLVDELSALFGASTIVVSIDVKKNLLGKRKVYSYKNNKMTGRDLVDYAREIASRGAGELFITSVDNEGTLNGYDTELITRIADAVNIPVIAHGGCGTFEHILNAFDAGVSAVSCGSKFVYSGPHNAVLINYITEREYRQINTI